MKMKKVLYNTLVDICDILDTMSVKIDRELEFSDLRYEREQIENVKNTLENISKHFE